MSTRLFSDAEIAAMEKRPVDRLTAAIEASDTDQAKRLSQRMYNEFLSMPPSASLSRPGGAPVLSVPAPRVWRAGARLATACGASGRAARRGRRSGEKAV